MSNVEERLINLIAAKIPDSRKFKELERLTGISGLRWQSLWHGRQRPMPDMIQAIARTWPEHAFWLSTGITDAKYGHTSPDGSVLENHYLHRNDAAEYFRLKTKLKSDLEKINEERKGKGLERIDILFRPTFDKLSQKYPRLFIAGKTYLKISDKLSKLDDEEKMILQNYERDISQLEKAREDENDRLSKYESEN